MPPLPRGRHPLSGRPRLDDRRIRRLTLRVHRNCLAASQCLRVASYSPGSNRATSKSLSGHLLAAVHQRGLRRPEPSRHPTRHAIGLRPRPANWVSRSSGLPNARLKFLSRSTRPYQLMARRPPKLRVRNLYRREFPLCPGVRDPDGSSNLDRCGMPTQFYSH